MKRSERLSTRHDVSGDAPQPAPPIPLTSPSASRPGWRVPPHAAAFLVALLASLAFLLLGPYQNFGTIGSIDPWLYTGYFTHFSYLLEHGGLTYYVSRLPWIIPGVLVFRVAQPEAASVLLNALILAVSVCSVFFMVSWRYGKWPALLAAIALGTQPYFLSAVAWDYPDGPAIAYFLVALAFLLRPRPGRVPNSVWAGVFLSLAFFTNMAGLPVLLGIFLVPVWRHRRSAVQAGRELAGVLAGMLAATLLLMVVGRIVVGSFLFFQPQIEQIRYVRSHPEYLANMWGTGNAWIARAYRLGLSAMVLAAGSALLLLRRRLHADVVAVYLFVVVQSLLFVVFEFGLHNAGLRVAYGSTYTIAPLFAFAGLLFGEMFGAGLAPRRAAAVALFGLSLPFWFFHLHPEWESSSIWLMVAGLALITALCWLPALARHPLFRAAGCAVLFAGLFLGPALDQGLVYARQNKQAVGFRSLMDLVHVVDAGVPPDRSMRFWYDSDESFDADEYFRSACSLYLYGYVDLSAAVPTVPPDRLRPLVQDGTTLVHLTLDPARIARRTQMLAARGVVVGNERRWSIASPLGPLVIVLQDVLNSSAIH